MLLKECLVTVNKSSIRHRFIKSLLAVSLYGSVSEQLQIVEHHNSVAHKVGHYHFAFLTHFFLLFLGLSLLLHHPILVF